MNWTSLINVDDLTGIVKESHHQDILIFKFSSRCSISYLLKKRLESRWNLDASLIKPYFLDLIRYRSLSNQISSMFEVIHESPQILVIRGGMSIFDASHLDISVADIRNLYAETN